MSSKIDLFPITSPLASPLVPRSLFGPTPKSSLALQRALIENHEKHHIFFHDVGLHNHVSHHLLALWYFGASESAINAAYKKDILIQRPIDYGVTPDMETIADANLADHLGDPKYYQAYLTFFTSVVNDIGEVAAIEKYIFSREFNVDPSGVGKNQPAMLQHYVAGFFHPMIHVGYGLEFRMPGMIIEGLAQAAVHRANTNALLPDSLFTTTSSKTGPGGNVDKITSKLSSVFLEKSNGTSASSRNGTHAFAILARMQSDPFYKISAPVILPDKEIMSRYADKLKEMADEWLSGVNLEDPNVSDVLETKMEEAIWMVCLMYGVSGWAEGKDYIADFLLMHLVTSSTFLSSHLAALSASSGLLLLRSYFSVSLLVWIMRCTPDLKIVDFYKATSSSLNSPKGNPWFPIIDDALTHPDEHLSKIQRSLSHFSATYGHRSFTDVGYISLPGIQQIDGTLFLRIAQITAEKMEKGKETGGVGVDGTTQWDLVGFTGFSETVPYSYN